jgi:hypothetical protein
MPANPSVLEQLLTLPTGSCLVAQRDAQRHTVSRRAATCPPALRVHLKGVTTVRHKLFVAYFYLDVLDHVGT